MFQKADSNRAITVFLAALLVVFGGYLFVYTGVAHAFAAEKAAKAEGIKDPAVPKDNKAANQEEDGLKLMMNMKAMQKDIEDVLMNDKNRVRFFDPEVTKGIINEDLLTRMELQQHALLDDFDRTMVEMGMKAEDLPDVPDVEADKPDLPEADLDKPDLPDVEADKPAEAKELDDEDLLKIAMNVKGMEKDLSKYMADSSTNWTFLGTAVNTGLFPRPFFLRQICLQRALLGSFANPFLGFPRLCPFFPRPPFFRPPFFRPPIGFPPVVRPPIGFPPIGFPPVVRPPVGFPRPGFPPGFPPARPPFGAPDLEAAEAP